MQSCVEDYEIENTETITPEPKELIDAHVYGRVIDEQNNPLAGAEVVLQTHNGSESLITDNLGYFEFPNVRLKGKTAFLMVNQSGKFNGFRRISALKNRWNYTEIKLLDKEIVGTINAGTGGDVITSEGAKLELPPDAVVTKNGAAYNGIVSVAMQWIDPTAEDLNQRIVGDLSGIDINGQEVVLGTYGMMMVELLDNSGNELEIAEGQNAQLTYPLPDDIHGDPPSTVPMWTYDEELGTWIEEGIANLENGKYVADVSHFSSWNVDWKGESIKLSGRVTINGQSGSILYAYQMFVSSPVFGKRGGFLSEYFEFWRFPANEEFTLEIVNICGQVVYEETYGPFSQDTDLGTIDVSQGNIDDQTISGTAVDCNNDPVEGAFVKIEFDSFKLYSGQSDMNGDFNVLTPYCGTPIDATIKLVDIENGKVSPGQAFTLDGNDVTLGNISICDEDDEFVAITVDTLNFYFSTPPDYIDIRGKKIEAEGNGYFFINTTEVIDAVGTYSADAYSVYHRNTGPRNGYWNTSPPNMTVTVTEYSDVSGELIRGTFSGTVTDSLQTSIPMDGSFKIEVE
jgi:hypothetical protein